jgi:hypothetical protein
MYLDDYVQSCEIDGDGADPAVEGVVVGSLGKAEVEDG